MSVRATPLPLSATAEDGTTLIELLVAMVSAVVVVGALFAILQFSTSQETRISNRVQANRVGRLAMTNVVDELHSACTGFGASAIQAPSETPGSPLAVSGPTDLWFLSTYGTTEGAVAAPASVVQHDIHWAATGAKSSTGQTLGTLTDYRFTSTGGGPEKWTFKALTPANASARVIAQNVIPPTLPATSTLFQYYKFKSETSSEIEPLTTAAAITAAAKANEVAKVSISFIQGPEGRDSKPSTSVSVSDSVLLRFNPAETGSEAENAPCA
jgi:type II secretory pathway pseudopilin PulG